MNNNFNSNSITSDVEVINDNIEQLNKFTKILGKQLKRVSTMLGYYNDYKESLPKNYNIDICYNERGGILFNIHLGDLNFMIELDKGEGKFKDILNTITLYHFINYDLKAVYKFELDPTIIDLNPLKYNVRYDTNKEEVVTTSISSIKIDTFANMLKKTINKCYTRLVIETELISPAEQRRFNINYRI